MAAKFTYKEFREEATKRATEILQQYAEKVEAQGQDSALLWLEAEAQPLIDKALSREDPMGAILAFETLLTIAQI